jgi:hypothetical protein
VFAGHWKEGASDQPLAATACRLDANAARVERLVVFIVTVVRIKNENEREWWSVQRDGR